VVVDHGVIVIATGGREYSPKSYRYGVVVDHGVIVIATGGREYSPKSHRYGRNSRVITQLELEESLAKGKGILKNVKNVVMIPGDYTA